MRFFTIMTLMLLTAVNTVSAQSYEEEIGFTFVKAKYLLETDRYDEAVREFNRVIKLNPSMDNVLALRAYAKYQLGAYLGTKKDILKYIELKGVSAESVSLLAKAEYQLSEFDASLNSLSTALELIKDDAELYEFRATIYLDRDLKLKACQDYESAAKLGNNRAAITAKKLCGVSVTPQKPKEEKTEKKEEDSTILSDVREKEDSDDDSKVEETEENTSESDDALEDDTAEIPTGGDDIDILDEEEPVIPEEPAVDPRLLDDSENELEIDEDLIIVIKGQGLGSREIKQQPNILILSDKSGDVVIDVCVSRGGRVVSTSFNQGESTIIKKSLISLALRKSKEFWFEKSDLKEQCGQIVFRVKGT